MGDPKKKRKKYKKPKQPWQKERIEQEKKILKEYGLKNKKEIWKAESLIRKFRKQAKILITRSTKQAKEQEKQIIEKLHKLNLIKKNSKLEDILNLTLKDLLERRLQTLVFKKKLARTIKQARQLITHGHIQINRKKITIPSYLVKTNEEDEITFNIKSPFKNPEHPERLTTKKQTSKKDLKLKGSAEEKTKK